MSTRTLTAAPAPARRVSSSAGGETARGFYYAGPPTLDGLPYPKRVKALEKQFKWLGRTGVFVFLYQVAEEVPEWENR